MLLASARILFLLGIFGCLTLSDQEIKDNLKICQSQRVTVSTTLTFNSLKESRSQQPRYFTVSESLSLDNPDMLKSRNFSHLE